MWVNMLHDVSEFDVIFLSYDEPNAEELYADLCNKIPWAKRVHSVKGFDAAHRACADASDTDFFITVDGDNMVHEDFLTLRIEIGDDQRDHAWTWTGRNIVNGLVYGNGGLKLWSKSFVRGMKSHENSENGSNGVDFCWDERYHDLFGCYSTSIINATPYQAFRGGFREGVKMSLDRGGRVPAREIVDRIWIHNLHKLLIWCSVGADVVNGEWAIYGARMGAYMCRSLDWDHTSIRDYDWFGKFWETVMDKNPIDESKSLGKRLVSEMGLDVADLDQAQSRFFKSVYINPSRTLIDNENLRHLASKHV